MPQLSLAELKKGDAVIVSSSKGPGDSAVTAFAFVAGVEPFLAAAPRTAGQVNLGSWNLDLSGRRTGAMSPVIRLARPANKGTKMKPLLLLLLLLLTLLPATYAQPTGIVHGVVTDESGALVPGATVTVSNAAGPVKSGTAGDDGTYSISGVPPGKYTVQATSPGLHQAQPFDGRSDGVAQSPQPTCNCRSPPKSRK